MSKQMSARELILARAKDRISGNFGNSNKHVILPNTVQAFSPEVETEYEIDFVPYAVKHDSHPERIPVGMGWPRRPFWLHRNIGSEHRAFVCRKSVGKPCFLCQERNKLFQEEASKAATDALRASYREMYLIYNKKEDQFEVFEVAYSNFGEALDRKINRMNDKRCGFFELEGGYTAICFFIEESFGKNKFAVLDEIDFEPRKDLDLDMEEIPCLDDMLVIAENKEMKAAYYDLELSEVEDLEGDEEVEKPTRSRRSAKTEETEEEVEEEKPSRSRRSAKVEDEKPSRSRRSARAEDDEAEEEEKPSRSRRREKVEEEVEERPSRSRRSAKVEDEDEDEEDDEVKFHKVAAEEAKPSRTRKPAKDSGLGPECPHGHEYGVDPIHEECEECTMWDKCAEVAGAEEEPEEEVKPSRRRKAEPAEEEKPSRSRRSAKVEEDEEEEEEKPSRTRRSRTRR